MTPEAAAASTASAIARTGQVVTLRRVVAGVNTDVDAFAVVRGYQPQELVGEITQADRQVIVSDQEITAAGWPGPPTTGDIVIIGGKSHRVQGPAETIVMGNVVVRHTLRARGG